jgi:hypothetical protein
MAESSNKGINKRIDKGCGFTEFGFEQSLPIFRMIGTEQKKNRITKFSYSGHPNNRIFGYLGKPNLVIWVIQRKLEKPNLAIITQKSFGEPRQKMESLLRKSQYFWEKILAKTPNPNFCKVSLHLYLGHSAKNWNLAFSAFFGEMSILGSQEAGHHQNWEHCQNWAPNQAQCIRFDWPIPIDWVWSGLIGSIAKIRS